MYFDSYHFNDDNEKTGYTHHKCVKSTYKAINNDGNICYISTTNIYSENDNNYHTIIRNQKIIDRISSNNQRQSVDGDIIEIIPNIHPIENSAIDITCKAYHAGNIIEIVPYPLDDI